MTGPQPDRDLGRAHLASTLAIDASTGPVAGRHRRGAGGLSAAARDGAAQGQRGRGAWGAAGDGPAGPSARWRRLARRGIARARDGLVTAEDRGSWTPRE